MILQKLLNILPSTYFDHVCVFSATPNAKGTLITANDLEHQPEALHTGTEECLPEETVCSHRIKDRYSSESSQQEAPVQHLAIKELPPLKIDDKETNTDINNTQSGIPHDLTGHITRSSGFPVALGSYGNIYQGTLNVEGGAIEVCHCLFSYRETKQPLDCHQDMQGVLAA